MGKNEKNIRITFNCVIVHSSNLKAVLTLSYIMIRKFHQFFYLFILLGHGNQNGAGQASMCVNCVSQCVQLYSQCGMFPDILVSH